MENNKKPVGPIIGIIIILAIIIIGGIYFGKEKIEEVKEQSETTGDMETDALMKQSESDELDAIEQDLDSTDLDSLDSGTSEVEGEF